MKQILFFLVVILFFGNCKKAENLLKNPIVLSDLTIRASFRITEVTLNGTSVYATYIPDCKKGDLYVFVGGGSYKYYDEGTTCVPASPTTGTYNVNSSTSLTLDNITYDVDSYTGEALILSKTAGSNKTVLTLSR